MKKLKLIALAAVLSLALVGCTEDKPQNQVEEDQTNVSDSQFSLGEWDDNVYTNEFLGVKLSLPSNWIRSSDEEIANLMNIAGQVAFADDEYKAKVAELTSVYYVFARDEDTNENLMVITEKPLLDVTMDKYIEALESQFQESTSVKYEIGEKSTGTLGDKEYTTLDLTAPDIGVTQRYYVRKIGKYFLGIIISTNSEENIAPITEFFE